ncbi:hypothetical protein N0V84_000548 [Fusarium piperis]|uniref:Ankyrin n=1 Tax=Fusarium piperis TaxID=1435070 RepID=A0A9W8WMQ2_9HYPO|nr:hypothetical protein N0V84_000548 [Fusarium piperis]
MIHQAIRGETTHSLDECIQMEPQHINTLDDVGFAPLHWAVLKQDMATFQTLIKATANVNQETSHKRETPLHFACMNHNVDMVRTLLELGASTSSPDHEKWTPLHHAINYCQGQQQEMDVVQMLLDARADPCLGNVQGETPLHFLFGNHDMDPDHATALATALIDAGADLEIKDKYGRTPLLYSCLMACKNVSILIDLGANVKAVDDNERNLLSELACNEDDMNPSLLHPKLLVGVDPDLPDEEDETPLEFLDRRLRDPIMWQPLSIRVVVDMVDLILGTREANWEAGLFLDKKEALEADGSHTRMRRWVMRQRRLMHRDESWGDFDFEEDDLLGWYQDEYSESTASDTDDDNNGSNGRDWSESEDSITFHDAHEILE